MKNVTQSYLARPLPLAGILAAAIFLGGCNGAAKNASPMPPMVAPQAYTEPEEQHENPGSLYSEASSHNLFDDNRARKVGDIVLVKIVETSKSKSKVDTTAERETTNSFGVSAAFGRNSVSPLFFGGGPLSGTVGMDPMLSTSRKSDHEATGETKRENYVTATMGARIVQVLPNGIMQVQGAREIKVNDETQYMVVTGLIRQRDIDSDNSILSTQMADSRIDYYGKGVLADKQKPGWLSRLLDIIWPF
ncbi:flagellar basal body L-ring protein FlgH [Desulfovibrio sp. OttesenSCG-928-O18]|nr:flagellar basal body L-ring protein FlgH [Desulfovibrio sp. OttesenSCG-928-O18]